MRGASLSEAALTDCVSSASTQFGSRLSAETRAIYTRTRFREEELMLVVSLDELAQTLAADGEL
jgi:hypothetical protein